MKRAEERIMESVLRWFGYNERMENGGTGIRVYEGKFMGCRRVR